MRKLTKTEATAMLVIVLLVAGVFVGRYWLRDPSSDSEVETAIDLPAEQISEPALPQEPFPVELYFPAGGSLLYPETRELAVGEDIEARVRGIVGAILAGPESVNLRAPLPSSVVLVGVYSLGDGQVVLDLGSPDGEPPSAGSRREILTVYSLVNSVVLNIDGLESVVLMWNGEQRTTFAGHLDTARPLYARPEMLARRRPARVEVVGTN